VAIAQFVAHLSRAVAGEKDGIKPGAGKSDSKDAASKKSDKSEPSKAGTAAAGTTGKAPAGESRPEKRSEIGADGTDSEPAAASAAGEGKAKVRSKPRTVVKPARAVEAPPEVAALAEGASPASPPPLTIAGLREEMHREGGPVALDPMAPSRMKLEQMLQEVTKARTSLHEETAKLEAMLTQDGGDSASAGPGGAAAVPGGKPAKNPLDVLAKALRGIKPEQAAPIVTRLERRLAATVLQRMPPVDAGKIMGAMKPETAAELATQIAMRPLPAEAKR
jgi:flagellar motility protein MotE (MotC chaperone)